jgi:hypothetical protein
VRSHDTYGGRSPKIAVADYDLDLFYTTGYYGLGDGNYGTVYGKVYAIFKDGTSRLLYDEYSYGWKQGFSSSYRTGPHYVANYLTGDERNNIVEIQITGYGDAYFTDPNSYHSGDNGLISYIYLYGRKKPWKPE